MTAGLASLAARAYGLRWRVLPPLTGVAMLAMLIGAVLAAPREVIEGEVQRLMYIHVPSATIGMYGSIGVVFVASAMVLWKRDMRWDAVARGAATVGVLFTALTLLTGAIWGRPVWGVYWAWDARLTSTLVLFLIYCGYLLIRQIADPHDEQTARYAAVFAMIGALDIPLINMSVRWWNTLHPQPIVVRPLGDEALPTEMLIVLLVGTVAISLLVAWLIVLRTETELAAQRIHGLRAGVDRREAS